jgi:hypothetical protein
MLLTRCIVHCAVLTIAGTLSFAQDFTQYPSSMCAISVREAESYPPLLKDEPDSIRKQHCHAVIYK